MLPAWQLPQLLALPARSIVNKPAITSEALVARCAAALVVATLMKPAAIRDKGSVVPRGLNLAAPTAARVKRLAAAATAARVTRFVWRAFAAPVVARCVPTGRAVTTSADSARAVLACPSRTAPRVQTVSVAGVSAPDVAGLEPDVTAMPAAAQVSATATISATASISARNAVSERNPVALTCAAWMATAAYPSVATA